MGHSVFDPSSPSFLGRRVFFLFAFFVILFCFCVLFFCQEGHWAGDAGLETHPTIHFLFANVLGQAVKIEYFQLLLCGCVTNDVK